MKYSQCLGIILSICLGIILDHLLSEFYLIPFVITRPTYKIEFVSVKGYILESVLGYNFEHDKQLAFGWLFIIAFTPYRSFPKRTKQLSTVEVAGLIRALAHIGLLTN